MAWGLADDVKIVNLIRRKPVDGGADQSAAVKALQILSSPTNV